ncbi:MAG: DEAD/DEAH box helicase family protein [Firmicutes bacterium]|nr:DEAD/DEAH box helicase family protein [Bacillota bacterium]
MPRLESHLVLNRYIHHLLGAEDFETLKNLLRPLPEGPDGSGQSYFFSRLVTQPGLKLKREELEAYDCRVMGYEARLRKARHDFQGFPYFQYLALLYTEIFLDKLTKDPSSCLDELSQFVADLRQRETELKDFPDFTPNGLRRLAFFMATGSGKTLIMHVNIWQVLYYLKHGRHPETLVTRPDGRVEFNNILLITTGEWHSAQHLNDLRQSGFDATLFIKDLHGNSSLFGPRVKVIEIHKLAEEHPRDGVSVVLDEIGPYNLVIVDEGHKGTSSDEQTWKNRQKRLSEFGFLLEYSATFAQAIGAASSSVQKDLLREYGQAILFDYSYAHFYSDGYGKDFHVLNLTEASPEQAHELLVGGLLAYYHQLWLFRQHVDEYRPYNMEKPLWVLLGSSVNAMYIRNRERRSDVAEVVAFLRRFLEEPEWAISVMKNILNDNSGFQDAESGLDLFTPHIKYLCGQDPREVYEHIRAEVFHGSGGLEVWELKQASEELGLRLSTTESDKPYFGIINIGDVSSFKNYLRDHLNLTVQEDNLTPSLFARVNDPESPIHLLIGAKKFIEGWSSWRVSSMGLLNIGRGEGSQVIQLFGRGVRLKGKGMSLKRSAALGEDSHPEGIRFLETLAIFGWNADYIQTFRQILTNEGIGKEFILTVTRLKPWPEQRLPVPQKRPDFDSSKLTWMLDDSGPDIKLELTPKLVMLTSHRAGQTIAGQIADSMTIDFGDAPYLQALNLEHLYLDLIEHKAARGYINLSINPQVIPGILRRRCSIRLPATEARNPEHLQTAASQVLKTYMDRFIRMKEREAESQNVEVAYLPAYDKRILSEYRIRVRPGEFLEQIEDLLKNGLPAHDDGEPLPRLYIDRSLFNPILTEGGRAWKQAVSITPPALNKDEAHFVHDLREYWTLHHNDPELQECELYLLRNLANSGIGLFHRSGFYPDFILWLHDKRNGRTHVCFVDPHGLHHDGLSGSADKFAALKSLGVLTQRPEFQAKQIRLSGFILTTTPLNQIRDAIGKSKDDLEKEYPLVFQEGDYVRKIMSTLCIT